MYLYSLSLYLPFSLNCLNSHDGGPESKIWCSSKACSGVISLFQWKLEQGQLFYKASRMHILYWNFCWSSEAYGWIKITQVLSPWDWAYILSAIPCSMQSNCCLGQTWGTLKFIHQRVSYGFRNCRSWRFGIKSPAITVHLASEENQSRQWSIKTVIKNVLLGPSTVARRIELLSEDQTLVRILLNAAEWINVTDAAQLMVFVHMIFEDSSTEEDFLTLNTRGGGWGGVHWEYSSAFLMKKAGGYHSHLQ